MMLRHQTKLCGRVGRCRHYFIVKRESSSGRFARLCSSKLTRQQQPPPDQNIQIAGPVLNYPSLIDTPFRSKVR